MPLPVPNAALDAAHKLVCARVQQFQNGATTYLHADYKEQRAREDFINPLFIALGWDVLHNDQLDPLQQEVRIEQSVLMAEGNKSADYAFSLAPNFKRTRFFVEAKKPSRRLKNATDCFQAVRYGWNGNTPLAILTDFEDLFVLDCRAKTDLESATLRILKSWHYKDWLDREKFGAFWSLFSREAVANGSIERYIESLEALPASAGKQKRLFSVAAQSVDISFLKKLEEWRGELAQSFYMARPSLSAEALTEATQRALDRLVFVRFLEDKLLETEDRVAKWQGGDAWRNFRAVARQLDTRYNGVLWKKHPILDDDTFNPSADVWAGICFEVSGTQTDYLFNLIPIPILGSIYERFLGNVIEIDDGHVKVAPKAEVRKAGGVYYTPEYIVDYIVKNTVERLILDKAPAQVAQMKFADIACGSGSFLLGVYDALLRWHGAYYNANPAQAKRDGCERVGLAWKLSLKQRRAILEQNIWGADIDAQAVEVSKLSLYLKLLEDETAGSTRQFQLDFSEKVLPDLERNIICGNSLVDFDITENANLTPEEEQKINPMDWKAEFPFLQKESGKFDAIVGNPPYGMVSEPFLKAYYEPLFEGAEGRFDNYELFIERALGLVKMNCSLGYIVPSPLLSNLYTAKLRRFLLDKHRLLDITNFGMDVFADPTVHTCIIIVQNGKAPGTKPNLVKVRKKVLQSEALLSSEFDYSIAQSELGKNSASSLDIFFDPTTATLINRLEEKTIPLGQIAFIRQCIKTGDDKKYVERSDKQPGAQWKPTLRGKSIGRYSTIEKDLWMNYGPWLARNWQNKTFYETEKIAIRETGNRITATLDDENRYFLSSLYSVYFRDANQKMDIRFLLALLNSRLATFYISKVAYELTQGAFTKVRTNQLARLPIRAIDLSDNTDKKSHDALVSLVEQMLTARRDGALSQTEAESRRTTAKIASLDRRIDELVYELYGLTEEEIALVEA
ncbi:MAG TPA: TaqI-like C-terminal specificity domain-containing protein [Abditibacterium sp.]|jgi:type I restriction-modification system DNA methylase subunit/predicted type IV restriction endonuclease